MGRERLKNLSTSKPELFKPNPAAERTSAAQEDIVTWMSERGTTDAPGVLKGILDFSRDFDSSFSRVYNAIGGAKGARAWT